MFKTCILNKAFDFQSGHIEGLLFFFFILGMYRKSMMNLMVFTIVSYKHLVFGHRNLTKNVTKTAVINILKTCILNLTFRMLVKIHFQKYNHYNFWKTIYTVQMGIWKLSKMTHSKSFTNAIKLFSANNDIQCWLQSQVVNCIFPAETRQLKGHAK